MKAKHFAIIAQLMLIIFLVACVTPDVQLVNSQTSIHYVAPCKVDTYGDAWDGYLAYGLYEYDSIDTWNRINGYLIVMKTDGELVYLHNKIVEDVEYVANDTLMYQGAPSGFLNLKTGETTDLTESIEGHHDLEYNPETNTFLTLQGVTREVNGSTSVFDKIVELNQDGEILWTWDTFDYFDYSQRCPYCSASDFTHSNTVLWNQEENVIYLNMRNLNTFCKINKTTSELIWSCGEYGDFKLIDENGKELPSLWYHSHAVKEVEPNVFLMFNNDCHNKTNLESRGSRILEVTLDDTNMTARISWSWAAPSEYWSSFWGDADRLPNGNRIGTFGTQTHLNQNITGAVLVEVNPEGEVVRTYTFSYGWGIYRIEQISSMPDSGNILFDAAPPIGSLSINDGATYAPTIAVTLNMPAVESTSGATEMRFSNDNITYSGWETIKATKSWTLQGGDGAKMVYVQFRDHLFVDLVSTQSDEILLDANPPTGNITIAEGNSYTNSKSVTLTLFAEDTYSGIAQMCFSHDNTIWTNWKSYSTSNAWWFTGDDGTKTVYVQFADNAGAVSESYDDTIVLDTFLPTITITSPSQGSDVNSSTVIASWLGSDDTSGVSHYEIRLDYGSWVNIGTQESFNLADLSEGEHEILIKAIDKAGNANQEGVTFTINTQLIEEFHWNYSYVALPIAIIAALGVTIYLLKTKRRKSY